MYTALKAQRGEEILLYSSFILTIDLVGDLRYTLAAFPPRKQPRYLFYRRGFDSRWCHWNFSLT